MSDPQRNQASTGATPPPAPPLPPPPAPPLPSQRYTNRATSALARFAHPFIYGSRPPSPQQIAVEEQAPAVAPSISRRASPQTVTHKTGIPISALDISPQRTHAVIAGREILKTVRVTSDHCAEEFNIRSAIIGYSSTHHVSTGAQPAKHKDQLAAKDVKWSHGEYDRIIATAAANGRIVIYDLTRAGVELGRFHEHNRQVHRLAFNPHRGAWLLSGSQDATIRMWDLRMVTGDRGVMNFGSKHRFSGHSEAVRDIRWSPVDGVEFATATDSGAIQRWDVRKENAPLLKINAHEKPCFSVDWHPDGKHLVSGSTDRQVKVWDFSSMDRRQKPCFQLRAPQAVLNVRWRPASFTSELPEAGNWQSTQIVTSYDSEDPRIHLWDLRRPHVPEREFDRYGRPPSDMLWHSEDLLWTVSNEGIFTQTDIKFVPQTNQRRPTCAVAWSPHGDVLAFSRKRPRRRGLSMNFGSTEFLGSRPNNRKSGEKATTQSLTDDGLDEAALVSLRKRPVRATTHAKGSKSLGGTPPMSDDPPGVVALEKAVVSGGVFEPGQTGVFGHVPGATSDADIFRYLAQHYAAFKYDASSKADPYPDDLTSLLDSFDENAGHAENASLYQLAQTWRIIKYAVVEELASRAKELQSAPPNAADGGKKRSLKDDRLLERPQNLDDLRPDKAKSRLFKGVIESEGPPRLMADPESTSNMTTPLAKPLPDSPRKDFGSMESEDSGLDDGDFESIEQLPPSILSDSIAGKARGLDSNFSSGSFEKSENHQKRADDASRVSPRSLSPDRMRERELALQGLFSDDQRSAPRAITGMASWRLQDLHDSPNPEEEDYDQKVEEKRAAIRDFKGFQKKVLSLDAPAQDNHRLPQPVAYSRHDSSDSFAMFSQSTDSSQRTKSLSESSPNAALERISQPGTTGWAAATESPLADIKELDIGSPPRPVRDSGIAHSVDELPVDDLPEALSTVHLERPSSPLPFLSDSVSRNGVQMKEQQSPRDDAKSGSASDQIRITLPLTLPSADSKPWSAHNMIRQAIKHYCSGTPVDIQSAARLLHKMEALFYPSENILPYEERELIYKIYNELLLRQEMFIEAAELRLLCVPNYPSVYNYAQQETFINLYCFECKKPYENPIRDNKRCHRCDTRQPPCTICLSQDPPQEWMQQLSTVPNPESEGSSTSSPPSPGFVPPATGAKSSSGEVQQTTDGYTRPRPHGASLWSWCQGCGHGAHAACQTAWLNDISMSEGGCATPGCFHDCGPGPRREQNRISVLEESKRGRDQGAGRKSSIPYAKRDSWAAGESRAVERVRGMLGVGGISSGSPSGAASASSSGTGAGATGSTVLSPKKVRLVTPSEQRRRRGNRGSGAERDSPTARLGRKESLSDPLASDQQI